YLEELGVDVIWLNPFYPSPQRDNGYDISDYTAVNPLFGSMADFEDLVQKGKAHGIDIMLDMVLNHCSTEHEWFQKALAGDRYYQISLSCGISRPTGPLNSAAMPGRLLGTRTNITCICLM